MLLATAGSRGDVEPFIALARRAQEAGHDVRVVAPDGSGVDVEGLDVVGMGVDYSRVIQDQGVSAFAAMASYRSVVRPVMHGVIVGGARAALDYQPDVIVAHPKVLSAGIVADALGIPHVLVEIVPAVTPTSAFAAAGMPTRTSRALRRLTFRAAGSAAALFRSDLDEVRALVGTSSRSPSAPAATLMPISPTLLRRPSDWPDSLHLTGAWVTRGAVDRPNAEVEEFVDAGPFVYAGFGSMAMGDAEARGRAVVDAARSRGARVLVATGLGGIAVPADRRGDDVLVVKSVAHSSVLPRATVAVHHGGIGTVHAATAAGTPSIVVPFIADQPFWAARLREQGLSPAPIRRRALSAESLGRALSEAGTCRSRVEGAARAMATEDGTGAALRALVRLV